ncbi:MULTISPECIES: type II toxin-antitoxin system death-on-curing family toxin [unclassified Thermoanaerobacterium]|uniref:type II toxin-antitoxin system death-on-curing family toxin n=1 Tax=unclassified Thermoanaerobacterium TaxID=2622527 RepID=UPI000A151B6F|nr:MULTISPECIES: type II toxin-antitoxin system death-on-curing family toxin [unclassified Thermoanaerobacterium]ORX22917.1 death-on-curing protein [Thermoanaerobacterium sp. PSU-2]
MIRLSVPQIVLMHSILIRETGGIDGIRDSGLLDLAANAPFQTFDGVYVYSSLEEKAARLGYSIIRNHPFIDGNKRIGMLAMMVFLELNGVQLSCTDQDIINAGLQLASGEMDDKGLLEWIFQHR